MQLLNRATDLIDVTMAIGAINISGNVYSPNGNNLNLDKTSGVTFRYSANIINDPKNPSYTTDPSRTLLSFKYRYVKSISENTFEDSALTTNVDPNHLDDLSGNPGSINPDKWTIQRIWWYAGSNNTYITYGQKEYDSYSDIIW